MYDFIALVEANRQMHAQFRDIPVKDDPEPVTAHPATVRTRLQLRLSGALHALANAIEPAPTMCKPTTSQQR